MLRYVTVLKISLTIKDMEKQEELRVAHMHLKEHREITDEFGDCFGEDRWNSKYANGLGNSNTKLQKQMWGGMFWLVICFIFAWNPLGMKNGLATLENSLAVLTLTYTYLGLVFLLLGYVCRENAYFSITVCTRMFIAALNIIAKNWNQLECLQWEDG